MQVKERNRGFTLVEILCVLAIMASLASMLFPMFARSRERARASNCLGNLHQLGLAMHLYVNDFDGHYPFAFSPRFKSRFSNANDPTQDLVNSHPAYTQVLKPYLHTPAALHCLSDTGMVGTGMDEDDPSYSTDAFASWGTSYDYAADVPEQLSHRAPFSGGFPTEPDVTPLFNDSAWTWHGSYQVVFADGHVGHAKPDELIDLNSISYHPAPP